MINIIPVFWRRCFRINLALYAIQVTPFCADSTQIFNTAVSIYQNSSDFQFSQT